MKSINEIIAAALKGEKSATSRLISLVERGDSHAPYILQKMYEHTGKAYYIGITGAPGAGKSTMVDKLVRRFCQRGHSVGVVAVDPSSPFSGGALLGDRVRVNIKNKDYDYFFRSMSAGKIMGGLSRTTREAARILDASGRDIIIIETVGVGQSELDIAKATDTVVVMLTPESGDGVQIMKAGLMEIADVFVVNKCDRAGAENIAHSLKGLLDRIDARLDWRPPIFMTSAAMNQGIDEVYEGLLEHRCYLKRDNKMEKRRRLQIREELKHHVEAEFTRLFWSQMDNGRDIDNALRRTWEYRIDPQNAAREIVSAWLYRVAGGHGHNEGIMAAQ
ncbi:methylmalonyl Co-A mutase-associated GTPase MeaB [Desulfocicer niacini]